MRFPPSGFLSPEKVDQLAKLLPESEEEPMDATEDYEEVRKKGSLATQPLQWLKRRLTNLSSENNLPMFRLNAPVVIRVKVKRYKQMLLFIAMHY